MKASLPLSLLRSKKESIIANCLTLPHNEKEMIRKDPKDKYFGYNW